MAEIESPTEARIKCPDCEETFVSNSGLSSHRRAAHQMVNEEAHARWQRRKQQIEEKKLKGTGKYVCDFKGCGRRFTAPTALGYHKRAKHGIVGKFSAKHELQKAKMVAVVARNRKGMFACPECGKEYKFPNALGKHRYDKHGVPGVAASTVNRRKFLLAGEKPSDSLTCEECGKGPFKSVSGLKIHQSTTHNKGVIPSGNGASSANEIATAFWISQTCNDFRQSAAINAGRVDLTAEEFGERCLAVLQGRSKTLRKLYRLPD